MEKIIILNKDNQKLSAIFHKPVNQTNKIVIFTHSFKGGKDYQPITREFSEHICNEGYALIRFDCCGSGESDGKFEDSSIFTQVEDLKDVIKYVKSQGYSEICLIGLSLGTTDSIIAYDGSIKCMVLWSPIFQHRHLYEQYKSEMLSKGFIIRKNNLTGEKFKVGRAMWDSFKDIIPYKKLPEIKSPVLAIISSKDYHISVEDAKKYMDMIPVKHELEVIEGGDHDFLIEEARKKAISLTTGFIKRYL